MSARSRRNFTPAFGAPNKTNLKQIGLHHILQRVPFLAKGRRQRLNARRPPAVNRRQRTQKSPIQFIQPQRVNLLHLKGTGNNRLGQFADALDLCIIPHTLEKAIGNPRRAAASLGYLLQCPVRTRKFQKSRRTAKYLR